MRTEPSPDADWTRGIPRILYSRCRRCGRRGYLPRDRCPTCGHDTIDRLPSDGVGTVTAITVVHRAPRGAEHPPTPFGICLVDLDEQVRAMGRCAPTLAVGDRVRAGFTNEVPHFVAVDSAESPT
ncbi:Zn-ribbon domain-containing OB-fold protein [Pseudonocardia sp. CA-142604]|uniref:Zn-ribbon domain-containing OB-fold protein n=1 Tax=Pseudonocardia sp. CA-142604 TaxID=3240024 RepID=UPI003D8CAA80